MENTYGEAIRRVQKNKAVDVERMKNIFSSLGTAESSAFINKMGDLEQAAGETSAITEREGLAKRAEIDKELTKLDDNIATSLKSIMTDKSSKIKAVNDQVNLTAEQKKGKLDQVNLTFQEAISDLKKDFNDKKIQLLQLKDQAAQTSKNILLQNKADESLLQKQYDYEKKAQKAMPLMLADDLKSFKGQSSMQKARIKSELQAKYPDWADVIEYASGGNINIDQLLAEIQAGVKTF